MTAQTAPALRLTFLVGAPHSGARWLQSLLAQHGEIATSAATELFSHYLLPLLNGDTGPKVAGTPRGFPDLLKPDEYRRFVTGAAAVALRRIAARRPGARILLEASPGHAQVWREILRYYPGARFIHMVRDPRECLAEAQVDKASSTAERPLDAPGVISQATRWQQDVDAVRELVEDERRCHEVRFEHLQEKPAEVMQRLLSWMGCKSERDQAAAFVSRVNQQCAGKQPPPWSDEAVMPRLAARDSALVELVARDSMIRYDYATNTTRGARRARLQLAAHRFLQMMEESAHDMRQRM